MQEWIGGELLNGDSTSGNRNGHEEPEVILTPEFHRDLKALNAGISEENSPLAFQWMNGKVDLASSSTLLLSTTTRFNVDNQIPDYYKAVINLKRINDIQRINKFFESVNSKLPTGGIFIGCGETYQLRKSRILNKYPPIVNYVIYSFDFLYRRVFPKLRLTNKIYFLLSQGKNRVLSRTETLDVCIPVVLM